MTYREHFMRLHPNALCVGGFPETYPCAIYGKEVCLHDIDMACSWKQCKKTWNRKMPPMTRADRIRSKTNEELAQLLRLPQDCYYCPAANDGITCDDGADEYCMRNMLNWLKQEVVENG